MQTEAELEDVRQAIEALVWCKTEIDRLSVREQLFLQFLDCVREAESLGEIPTLVTQLTNALKALPARPKESIG